MVVLVNRDGVHFNSTVQGEKGQVRGLVMQEEMKKERKKEVLEEVRISPNITIAKLKEWQLGDEMVSGVKEILGQG